MCDAAVDVVHDVAVNLVNVVCDMMGTKRRGHDGAPSTMLSWTW
jgi:hypothetical protein